MHQEASITVAANDPGVQVTATMTTAREYMVTCYNGATKGTGVTAYITKTAAEDGPNYFAIPPQSETKTGPFVGRSTSSLPFLWGASAQNIICTVQWSDVISGAKFTHKIKEL